MIPRLQHVGCCILLAACASSRSEQTGSRGAGVPRSSSPPFAEIAADAQTVCDAAAAVVASASPAPTPATTPPEPMPGTLPSFTLEQIRSMHPVECTHECTVGASGHEPPESVSEDMNITAPSGAAWIELLHNGATVHLPRVGDNDLLGVVVFGQATLARIEGGGRGPLHAPTWTAFMLPESGATVHGEGTASAIAFVTVDSAPQSPAPPPRNERARGGFALVDLNAAPDLTWAGGAFHARIAFEAPGSPNASLEVLMASPHAAVPEHEHPNSWEVLLALSAGGHLHVPQQRLPGERNCDAPIAAHDRPMAAGSVAYVPIGLRHAWEPDGTVPLVAIQSYAPPGPEQRFRTLAGAH